MLQVPSRAAPLPALLLWARCYRFAVSVATESFLTSVWRVWRVGDQCPNRCCVWTLRVEPVPRPCFPSTLLALDLAFPRPCFPSTLLALDLAFPRPCFPSPLLSLALATSSITSPITSSIEPSAWISVCKVASATCGPDMYPQQSVQLHEQEGTVSHHTRRASYTILGRHHAPY
jgi:hypothetical protein